MRTDETRTPGAHAHTIVSTQRHMHLNEQQTIHNRTERFDATHNIKRKSRLLNNKSSSSIKHLQSSQFPTAALRDRFTHAHYSSLF